MYARGDGRGTEEEEEVNRGREGKSEFVGGRVFGKFVRGW